MGIRILDWRQKSERRFRTMGRNDMGVRAKMRERETKRTNPFIALDRRRWKFECLCKERRGKKRKLSMVGDANIKSKRERERNANILSGGITRSFVRTSIIQSCVQRISPHLPKFATDRRIVAHAKLRNFEGCTKIAPSPRNVDWHI